MLIKPSHLPDLNPALLMCTAAKLGVPVETVFDMAAEGKLSSPEERAAFVSHAVRTFNGERFLLKLVQTFCEETLGIESFNPESPPTSKVLNGDPNLKGGLD